MNAFGVVHKALDPRDRETKKQKRQGRAVSASLGALYGGYVGGAAGKATHDFNDAVKYRDAEGHGAYNAFKARVKEKGQTQRKNPNFNHEKWDKLNNLHERAGSEGERNAANAAKERMMAGGEKPYVKAGPSAHAYRALGRALPKAAHARMGAAVGAGLGVGAASYGLFRGATIRSHHVENKRKREFKEEIKSEMKKNAFGVNFEYPVEKAAGSWKTIDQRQDSQYRARRWKRRGLEAAGVGGGVIGAAELKEPGSAKSAYNNAKAIGLSHRFATLDSKNPMVHVRALKDTAHYARGVVSHAPRGTQAALAGGAVVAGGALAAAGGRAAESYQQHRINQRRKSNVKKNAFGVSTEYEIDKRFFSEKARKKDAKSGDALPDGSFPIKNKGDLANAERLEHFSSHPKAVARLIARKKKELGAK